MYPGTMPIRFRLFFSIVIIVVFSGFCPSFDAYAVEVSGDV